MFFTLILQNFQMPNLNDEDQVCLVSCMDEIRNVVGETISEKHLVETIMRFNFDYAKALDAILNNNIKTPPKHNKDVKLSSGSTSTGAASQSKEPMETGNN